MVERAEAGPVATFLLQRQEFGEDIDDIIRLSDSLDYVIRVVCSHTPNIASHGSGVNQTDFKILIALVPLSFTFRQWKMSSTRISRDRG